MKNFQSWLTLGTAVIPAFVTGLLSFLASWLKSRSSINNLKVQFEHDIEKLALSHKHQLESIENQHLQEIDSLKQSHELRLSELEKVSKLNAETDLSLKQNELIYKVMTGEVDFEKLLTSAEKAEEYNKRQVLQRKFIK